MWQNRLKSVRIISKISILINFNQKEIESDRYILKKSIYFYFFNYFCSIWISFWLKLIDFDLFDIIRTHFNRFRHEVLKSGFKFGSIKSIKRWFDQYISPFGNLNQFYSLSLVQVVNYKAVFGVKLIALFAHLPKSSD